MVLSLGAFTSAFAAFAGLTTFVERPAVAQAWQCKAPANLARPVIELPKKSDIRRTPVDAYMLALSWSRERCRTGGKDPDNRLQCDGSIGDFGFIVHGLWPEAKGPDYPQYCKKAGVLSRKVIADNICMTPSVQLLQHEWAKHGTCMTNKPETYFAAAKTLFQALEFPDMERLSRQEDKPGGSQLTAGNLADAMAASNEGLPASAVRVKSDRQGWLQEIRICLDRKFKPHACPKFSGGAPSKSALKIWRSNNSSGKGA